MIESHPSPATIRKRTSSSRDSNLWFVWTVLVVLAEWAVVVHHQHATSIDAMYLSSSSPCASLESFVNTTTTSPTTVLDTSAWSLETKGNTVLVRPFKNNTTNHSSSSSPCSLDQAQALLQVLWRKLQWKKAQNRHDGDDHDDRIIPSIQVMDLLPRRRQLADLSHNNATSTTSNNNTTITVLATHLSMERLLTTFSALMERWQGPISAAIYISDASQIDTLMQAWTTIPLFAEWVTVHVVLEDTPNTQGHLYYPHNTLRELALRSIDPQEVDFFLAVDCDFLPPHHAYQHWQALVHRNPDNMIQRMHQHQALFVWPAFMSNPRLPFPDVSSSSNLPSTRDELLQGLSLDLGGTIWPFQKGKGHNATNYAKWAGLTEQQDEASIDTSNHTGVVDNDDYYYIGLGERGFEPYFVGSLRDRNVNKLPHYWTGFRGYGRNKMSWTHECMLAGYRFYVLRDFFVVHHGPTAKVRQGQKSRNKLEWERRFLPYLLETYEPGPDMMEYALNP